ncbi:MAG: RsbRD N-terminal domain-containing protein [Candidatus Zixiibacteriota bacterium]
MNPAELFHDKRDLLVERWFNAVAETYPADTARFLRDNADQFHNPVGHTLRRCLPVLFDALTNRTGEGELSGAVAEIVRIRAVQCSAPSQAAAFVYLIKNVVRAEFDSRSIDPETVALILEFESKVDSLALTVFDEYMQCREKICDIRVQQARQRSAMLVDQINRRQSADNVRGFDINGKSQAGNI